MLLEHLLGGGLDDQGVGRVGGGLDVLNVGSMCGGREMGDYFFSLEIEEYHWSPKFFCSMKACPIKDPSFPLDSRFSK